MTEYKRGVKKEVPEGIVIDNKFRIIYLDDQNLSLEELRTVITKPKDDQPGQKIKRWESDGCFYHNIPSALKAYAKLRQNRAKSMDELLSIIEDIHTKIDNLFTVKVDGKNHSCKCKG